MPASKNILGPDPLRGAVTSRPAKVTIANNTPYWFNTCTGPSDPAQTKISIDFLNDVLAVLRELAATSGALQSETASSSDLMASESAARYASGGINATCSGSANTYTLAATGSFIVPLSLFDGMIVVTTPSATNTGASTATVFGLPSKAVRTHLDAALPAGALVVSQPTAWKYSTAANGGAGAWLLLPWAVPGVTLAQVAAVVRGIPAVGFIAQQSTQSIANNTITTVTSWPTIKNQLIDGTFSSGTYTVGASEAGWWALQCNMTYGATISSIRATVVVNGNVVAQQQITVDTTRSEFACAMGIIELVAGDVVTAQTLQISGGSLALSGERSVRFSGARVGASS